MNEQQPASPEHESTPDSPRVWIASLADYNAGRLHGDWVDAAVEGDELVAAAEAILATSQEPGAEEWAIFDFDNFGPYRVGEYEDLHQVAAVARGIAEDGEAFATYAQLSGARGEDLETGYVEAFVGYWHSLSAFVDDLLDDLGIRESLADSLPDWLAAHVSIDRDGVLRDLLVDLHYEDASDGGVYIYRL